MNLYINKILVAIISYKALPAYLKFLIKKIFTPKPKNQQESFIPDIKRKIDPNQLFLNIKSLKNHINGYWYIEPSIDLKDLNDYYTQAYWEDFKKGLS